MDDAEHGPERGGEKFGAGAVGAVPRGDLEGDESSPSADQAFEARLIGIGFGPERRDGPSLAAIGGDLGGADGVAFAEGSEGADEGPQLEGVGAVTGRAGAQALLDQQQFATAGRPVQGEAGGKPAAILEMSGVTCGKPRSESWKRAAIGLRGQIQYVD